MSLDLVVVNPVYVENLGMFLREAQLSWAGHTFVEDGFKLLNPENRQRLISWSGRASYHNPPTEIADTKSFLRENSWNYRRIATVVRNDAKRIFDFTYSERDILVFWDERNGLSSDVIDECDEMVYIPQVQAEGKNRRIQCRTLVSAQAIFLYEYLRQTQIRVAHTIEGTTR